MNLNLDKLSKQQIIYKLNESYRVQTERDAIKIYHLLINDNLTTDDLCDVYRKYGIDLQKKYLDMVSCVEYSEDNENEQEDESW